MSSFAHPGLRWITLGWTTFIAENVVATHYRDTLIDTFGTQTYHYTYSAVSSIACLAIAKGYLVNGRRQGPVWSNVRFPSRIGSLAFTTLGLIGLSQMAPPLQVPIGIKKPDKTGLEAEAEAKINEFLKEIPKLEVESGKNGFFSDLKNFGLSPRCPIDFKAKKGPDGEDDIYGLKRVTRHESLWILGFLGAGKALSSPFACEIVMYSFFLVFALIGGEHQDYRYRRGSGGELSAATDKKTSNIPFLAFLSGEQQWQDLYKEMKLTNASLATIFAVLIHFKRFKIIK